MQEAEERKGAMRIRAVVWALVGALVAGLAFGALDASAHRQSLVRPGSPKGEENWLSAQELAHVPAGQIEGACGLAISPPSEALDVSDYYHRAIHSFSPSGIFIHSLSLAGGDPPLVEIEEQNAVCGLAADSAGQLYGNEFHQAVVLLPAEEVIDPGRSTGVAVDDAGNVYVDNRTYVAVYDAPVEPGEEAAERIGENSLGDGYGIAVDSETGRIYVPDASDETIKVFKRGVGASIGTIAGPTGQSSFNSLLNASVAVDESPTEGKGHLLVVDNLQPLHQRPQAAVYEFDSSGAYLDTLQPRTVGPPGEKTTKGPIFGEPSGIVVDPKSGDLFVTTGNSEQSNVVAYGPYEPGPPTAAAPGSQEPTASPDGPVAARASAIVIPPSSPVAQRGGSEAVIVRRGPVQVSFDGKLAPKRLPRHGLAPVGIAIDARISATGNGSPPQLRRISIAINRHGHFASTGLPACQVDQIQPSTTSGALAACGSSLVGEGHFSADVKLPEQSPFPSEGKVLAFNGRVNGKPAILAHIYGTQPAPTSAVLPFLFGDSHGTYGTTLEASLPQATGSWGYVTGLKMSLRRRFSYQGEARSFLSAGCPAPAGFPSTLFPLARTSFVFAGGPTLVSVLNRTCTARG
jgi:DNA-binding beta-propeller fold protein YncE